MSDPCEKKALCFFILGATDMGDALPSQLYRMREE
jgi:hypothetical protein